MTTPKSPGPFHVTVQDCHPDPRGRRWIIFGEARGRYIRPGTVLLDDEGKSVTMLGHCHMRMISGPNKWGWVVDREVPVGTALREDSDDLEVPG